MGIKFCDYGCGQEATHQFKNGKWCCNYTTNKCPVIKNKNSKTKIGILNPAKRPEVKIKLSDAAKKRLYMFGETNPAKRPEVRLMLSGDNNPNWRGGIACDPYCEQWLDVEYKESIKIRDNYKCLNPKCNKKSNNLCIHHIDYNKKNCHPKNLITLCYACNSEANYNRKWHYSWYNAIIFRRKY